ncbi:uncharacterized protein [Solanum tuberosum]|uniref:uncharacterized protein n=1 Tax=Solanum tuberosum TaxID=4113 RepID=UPI00073A246B|nr:PREDICTED: uncharacterized protein LOC107061132 [Solanum tuberosum]
MIDSLFKPLASHLTKGDIKYSQTVDVARELETRWRDERTVKVQNKRTRTMGFFEGDMGTKRGFGSQNHPRASQTGGASIIQPSNNASTLKQSRRSPISSTGQTNRTTTICPSCHKAHSGQCWREIGACLRCGQMGHYKKDCPRYLRGSNQASTSVNSALTNSAAFTAKDNFGAARKGAENRNANDRGPGTIGRDESRVFALTRQDVEASNAVITGILSVCSFDAMALIDPGSTHSYMYSYFAIRFDRLPKLLKDPFLVATSVGESLLVKRVYHSCRLSVKGKGTVANLFELEMVDFDLILSMDWLASCHAIVDCHSKIVRFNIPGEPNFMLQGNQVSSLNNLISFMNAKRMLSKGCQGFLAFVRAMKIAVPELESVHIVSEFQT